MYCIKCNCGFPEWVRKCPTCKLPIVKEQTPEKEPVINTRAYDTLVNFVKDKGGRIEIDLSAIEVVKEKLWRFPYLGYGLEWTKKMRGKLDGNGIDLITTEVGMEKKWSFPYQGYGLTWEERMQGSIKENEFILSAKKVNKEKKWSFPYQGYGFAWTEEMSCNYGENLKIDLITTDVGKEKKWGFPYFGFGFSWINKAELIIAIK